MPTDHWVDYEQELLPWKGEMAPWRPPGPLRTMPHPLIRVSALRPIASNGRSLLRCRSRICDLTGPASTAHAENVLHTLASATFRSGAASNPVPALAALSVSQLKHQR